MLGNAGERFRPSDFIHRIKHMKRLFAARRWICAWACVGMIFPFSAADGQQPGPLPDRPIAPASDPVPAILDVELAPGGILSGQVVDAGGAPLGHVSVSVWRDTQEIGRTVSDREGRFAVSGLNGGLHRVVAANGALGMQLCRAWAPDTAPPIAQRGVLVVASGTVARGDGPPPVLPPAPVLWMTTPWVLAGAVVLAVAVPVAVFNHRENKTSKS